MSTPFRFNNADNTTVDFEDYYVRADYFRSGNLWSWGYNNSGQLGDNTTANKSSPVQTITGGTNWKQVAVGGSMTACIKTDGTLWCWGYNYEGQIGDNTTVKKSSPVQTIAGGTNWKSVTCGSYHCAAIKTDGTLWGWGSNNSGQLAVWGGGSPASAGYAGTSPVTVSGSRNGTVATFLTSNTTGVSVGMNVYTSTGAALWTTVTAINTNVSITFDTNNQYSRETWTGTVSLGVGAIKPSAAILDFTNNRSSPVQTVAFGTNWKQVSCGQSHTAAIKTDGTLWCWGYGGLGGLGDNSITNRSSPVQTVAFGTNWMQVSVGSNYTTCIKTDGTLWTWGSNATYGQLGDNTVAPKSSPVQTVAFGTNWKQVSAGNGTTTCIKTDGTLWCWGYGGTGLLGDNTNANKSSPVQTVTGGNNWKQVSCFNYTTAIKTDGTLWCWGGNSDGGLGDNTTTTRSSPVQTIMYGTNWNQVSGGFYQAAAIQYQDDYQ